MAIAMKQKITLKARAIRYLSIREYSVRELARKLSPYASDEDDLDALMEWLQARGFLSESRFVDAYVRRQSVRYGNARILRDLQNHGVSDSVLHDTESEMLNNEFERAWHVWRKKFGHKPSDIREQARQIRFLQQRGFSGEIIRQVMKSDALPD